MQERGVKRRMILGLAASVACVLATGCQNQSTLPFAEKVQADVDMNGEMKTITASGNEQCQNGVRKLRGEDWSGAAVDLRQASAKYPKDWRAAYALGIAEEKLGNYAAALAAYEQANLHIGGAGNADVTAALLRLRNR